MSTNTAIFSRDLTGIRQKSFPYPLDLSLSQGAVSGSAVPDMEIFFQQGLVLHQQGNLSRAGAYYQQVLACCPSHAEAWCHWGTLALADHDYPAALKRIQHAISLCDTNPVFFNHYGVALKSLERYQEAKEAFETALILNPDDADAWSNIGQMMLSLKHDPSHIEYAFRHAIRLAPQHSEAHYFLATLLLIQEKNREALTHLELALVQCRTNPVYFQTYAVTLKKEKRHDEVLSVLETVIRLDPNHVEARWQIAMLLHELGRPTGQVEQVLSDILQLQPEHNEALSLLAEIRHKQHRYEEARHILQKLTLSNPYDRAIHERIARLYAADRKHLEALNYVDDQRITENEEPQWLSFLAVENGECGNIEQSKNMFRRVAVITRNNIYHWKHLWYCPPFFENAEEIDLYWLNLNHDLDAAIAESPVFDWRQLPHEGFTSSFHLPHHKRCCREVKEKFATLLGKSFFFHRPKSQYAKRSNGKIRVGFLVTPGHEGGFLRMMRGVMERLNPNRYEVFVFYHQDFAHRFHCIKKDEHIHLVMFTWWFEQTVQMIREIGCDILYHWKVAADLWSTFFPMTYLAPVQCTAWGTHGTGGIPHVDYSLTWDHAEISESQEHYTETLFRLATPPNFEVFVERPNNVSRNELGLPKQGAIYFCPHRLSKYHPDFDLYLRDILETDPNGHILLLSGKPSLLSERLKSRMRRNLGDSLFRQMIFLSHQSVEQYYKYLAVSTMVLDSPVYSGELTCYDAFSLGVPCVTQTGPLLVQRYTTAHYHHLGIDGPIAENRRDYVAHAVQLGTNAEDYQKLCSQLLDRRHQLTNKIEVIGEYERFFEEVAGCQKVEGLALSQPVLSSQAHDELVPVDDIEINVAYGCNLNCEYCAHFSRYTQGLETQDNIIHWYETWSKKIRPRNIRLIGGEPLLHPQLGSLIRKTHEYWPDSGVQVTTNGLLFHKTEESVIEALREIDVHVYLSQHYNDSEYNKPFYAAIDRLIRNGIRYTIFTSHRDWRKTYHVHSEKRLLPYQSNASKAWENCQTKNVCPTIIDNKIFKCQHIAHVVRNRKSGLLGQEWEIANSYHPLSPDATHEEIDVHLHSGAIKACSICPERYEYISLVEKKEGAMYFSRTMNDQTKSN